MGVDFAQNMDIPHFGKEQPTDIYYFSPLTVNVFGCTDLTSKPTQMQAYTTFSIWHFTWWNSSTSIE